VQSAIRAVDPAMLVGRAVALRGLAHLPSDRAVQLIAAGKAASAMAGAAVHALGDRVRGGFVVSPFSAQPPPPLDFVLAEHPQPGAGSVAAGRRALTLARSVTASADLLVLLSGGASSLLVAPADGITLDEKRAATGILLRAGADIYALNTFRKHVSAIKGGRLAAACPSRSITLVLSDVVGDDLSVIGSGPTVPDPSTFADALQVIDTFGGRTAFPVSVVEHLLAGSRGEREESPKPGDPRMGRASTSLIGGRRDAMNGAAAAARERGYNVVVLDEPVTGEARRAGPSLVARALKTVAPESRPACVIGSGETTVRVNGTGVGGRNQELALAVADRLSAEARAAVFASVGTDGVDGPTDAAGAIVDGSTVSRVAARGLPPIQAYLDDNNAYELLDCLGDLVRMGPTGTNVGDLQVFLLA
jgi:glycerate 2-kinase